MTDAQLWDCLPLAIDTYRTKKIRNWELGRIMRIQISECLKSLKERGERKGRWELIIWV